MSEPLRIVLCSAFVGGYRLVADWAAKHGHRIAMLVTLPATRPLTDDECWLDWREPARVLQRRYAALNLLSPRARVHIGGESFQVLELRAADPGPDRASPGTVLDRSGDTVAVGTADGTVEVRVRPLAVDREA